MMQKLVIIAALVACSLAAPIEKSDKLSKPVDLLRPSPINPDIPSDPKPEEKITLIKDAEVKPIINPMRLGKADNIPGPYVPPSDTLTRSKRDPKDSSGSKEDSSEEKHSQPLKTHPLTTSSTPSLLKEHDTESKAKPIQTDGTSSSSTTMFPKNLRKPYSPRIHQHNEHLFKPSTSTTSSTSTSTTVSPSQDHNNEKRDIPVPLTRKYHHDDDDDQTKPKEEPVEIPKEEAKQEEEKNEGQKAEPVAVQHLPAIARPIPVAELFAKKPSD